MSEPLQKKLNTTGAGKLENYLVKVENKCAKNSTKWDRYLSELSFIISVVKWLLNQINK